MLLITCIVFIAAGIFHAVENGETRPDLEFGDALYYVVVTIATVGYGDIAPHTTGGKAVAVAVIFISFTIIPRELSRLNQLIAMQSQFRKTYVPAIGNPHILVVGHVTDPRCLLNFFREFYHPDRIFTGDSGVRSPRQSPCVIMGPEEPAEEIISLLDHPVLQHRVTYIKGSVMSEEDLCRVGADAARACFILVSKLAADRQQADAEAILRLLAVRNYNPELEIFSQIVSPTYLSYISDASPDHLLCLKQFKLALMAKSCLYPGLISLICNMCRSSAVSKREKLMGDWQQEYTEGMSLEVYATTLPHHLDGLTFSQAAEVIYKCTQGDVILLGAYEGTHPMAVSRVSTKPESPSRLPKLRMRAKTPDSEDTSKNVVVDRMLSNPGESLIMREWHVVYVLSDNKKLTLETTLTSRLKDWVAGGNVIPNPRTVALPSGRGSDDDRSSGDDDESDGDAFLEEEEIRDPSVVTLDLRDITPVMVSEVEEHSTRAAVQRRQPRKVVIDSAVHPVTGDELRDHVIVVSDLDHPSLVAFVTMLRLKHHTAITSSRQKHRKSHRKRRQWPILFLSWSAPGSMATTTQTLQHFDDVFVMLATSDSKSELMRANLLRARHCVLLADNSAVQNVDGGSVDSHIILHYLAVMAIQTEAMSALPLGTAISPPASRASSFSSSTSTTLVLSALSGKRSTPRLPRGVAIRPIVELSIPRTMHILDTELRKRVLASMPTRLGTLQRRLSPSADAELVRAGSFGYKPGRPSPQHSPHYHRQSSKDNVKTGAVGRQPSVLAQSISNLDQTLKSRKQKQMRMSTIRREQESSQRRHFDFRGPTALPFYAAGYGFADDIFDNMLCQSYFTPGLVRFMRELLFSENGRPSGHHTRATRPGNSVENDEEAPVVSSLIQVPVPNSFVSRTFGELFVDLIANGNIIAIGLYRKTAAAPSLPYVAAGPKKSTVLQSDDLVFALAPPRAWKQYSTDMSVDGRSESAHVQDLRSHNIPGGSSPQPDHRVDVEKVVEHMLDLQNSHRD